VAAARNFATHGGLARIWPRVGGWCRDCQYQFWDIYIYYSYIYIHNYILCVWYMYMWACMARSAHTHIPRRHIYHPPTPTADRPETETPIDQTDHRPPFAGPRQIRLNYNVSRPRQAHGFACPTSGTCACGNRKHGTHTLLCVAPRATRHTHTGRRPPPPPYAAAAARRTSLCRTARTVCDAPHRRWPLATRRKADQFTSPAP
jgi:hypothetical protein